MSKLEAFEEDVQKFSKDVQQIKLDSMSPEEMAESLKNTFSMPKVLESMNEKFEKIESSAGDVARKYGIDGEVWLVNLDGKPALKDARNAYERALVSIEKKMKTFSWLWGALAISGVVTYELSKANTDFMRDLRNAYWRKKSSERAKEAWDRFDAQNALSEATSREKRSAEMIDANGVCTSAVNPKRIHHVISMGKFNLKPNQKIVADYTNVKWPVFDELMRTWVITKDNKKVSLERVNKISRRSGNPYETFVYPNGRRAKVREGLRFTVVDGTYDIAQKLPYEKKQQGEWLWVLASSKDSSISKEQPETDFLDFTNIHNTSRNKNINQERKKNNKELNKEGNSNPQLSYVWDSTAYTPTVLGDWMYNFAEMQRDQTSIFDSTTYLPSVISDTFKSFLPAWPDWYNQAEAYSYTLPEVDNVVEEKKQYSYVSPSVVANQERMRENWECPNPLLKRFQAHASCAWFVQSTMNNLFGRWFMRDSGLESNSKYSNAWHALKKLEANGYTWDLKRYNNVTVENNRIRANKMNVNQLIDIVEQASSKSFNLMGLYTIGTWVSESKLVKKNADVNSHLVMVTEPKTRVIDASSGTVWDAIVDFFKTLTRKPWSRSQTEANRDLLGTLWDVRVQRNWEEIKLWYDVTLQEFVDSNGEKFSLQKGDKIAYEAAQYSDYVLYARPRNRVVELAAILMVENYRIPVWQTDISKDKLDISMDYKNEDTGESIDYKAMVGDYFVNKNTLRLESIKWDKTTIDFFVEGELGQNLREKYEQKYPKKSTESDSDYKERITKSIIKSIEYYKAISLIQYDGEEDSSYYGFSISKNVKIPLMDWEKEKEVTTELTNGRNERRRKQRWEKLQQSWEDMSGLSEEELITIESSYNLGSTRAINMKSQMFIHQCIEQISDQDSYALTDEMKEYLTIPIAWAWGRKTKFVLNQVLDFFNMSASKNQVDNRQYLLYLVNNHKGIVKKYGKQEIILTTKDVESKFKFDESAFRSKRSERLDKAMDFDGVFDHNGKIDGLKLLSNVWPDWYWNITHKLNDSWSSFVSVNTEDWKPYFAWKTHAQHIKAVWEAKSKDIFKGTYMENQPLALNKQLVYHDLPAIIKTLNKYSPSQKMSKILLKTLVQETGYTWWRHTKKGIAKTLWWNIKSLWHFQVRVDTFRDSVKKLWYDQHHKYSDQFKKYMNMSDEKLEKELDTNPVANTIAALAITSANASSVKKQLEWYDTDKLADKVHRWQAKEMKESFGAVEISLSKAQELWKLKPSELPKEYIWRVLVIKWAKDPTFNIDVSGKRDLTPEELATKNLLQEYFGTYPPPKTGITLHGAAADNTVTINALCRNWDYPFAILDNGLVMKSWDERKYLDASWVAGMIGNDPLSPFKRIPIEFAGRYDESTWDVVEPNDVQLVAWNRLKKKLQRQYWITSIGTSAQAVQDHNGKFVQWVDGWVHIDTHTWDLDRLWVNEWSSVDPVTMLESDFARFEKLVKARIAIAANKKVRLWFDPDEPGKEEKYWTDYLNKFRKARWLE